MKVGGIRKRSYKKSWSAATSGRYTRMMKRMVNPLYGKKGIGYLKNPSKALKSSIYHSTTLGFSPSDISRGLRKSHKKKVQNKSDKNTNNNPNATTSYVASRMDESLNKLRYSRTAKIKEENELRDQLGKKYHLRSIRGGNEKIAAIATNSNNQTKIISGFDNQYKITAERKTMVSDNAHITRIKSCDPKEEEKNSSNSKLPKINPNRKNIMYTAIILCVSIILLPVLLNAKNAENEKGETNNTFTTTTPTTTTPSSDNNKTESTQNEPTHIDDSDLIEGSQYDPICKKAIVEKYGVRLSSIHWTYTQHEDDPNSKKIFATLNYGGTYGGESAYVCYLFYENGKISTVIYDL